MIAEGSEVDFGPHTVGPPVFVLEVLSQMVSIDVIPDACIVLTSEPFAID